MEFKVIDNVFEGMLFNINCSPTELHNLFSKFKSIKIDIVKGIYYIKFLGMTIASINTEGTDKLILTPGMYIHRKVEVFKTYNKILSTFTTGYFLKFIANKWTLCKS